MDMTDFGKWIQEYAGSDVDPEMSSCMHQHPYCKPCALALALASLTAQLHGVAKGYMEWEADMILDSGVWRTTDGLPHLTQHHQDKLMALQGQRNAALAACKEFQERYS